MRRPYDLVFAWMPGMLSPEEHFRIISETASDAIVTIDESSTILFANPAAIRLFGYSAAELIGQPLSMLMPHRMRAAHHRGVARHASTRERTLDWRAIELPGLHRDGHELDLEISFGDYEADGKQYYTGIMRDVSERKQVRRRLAAEREVMQILASAHDMHETTDKILATLGRRFDWAFGSMWIVDEKIHALRSYAIWHGPEHPLPNFTASTRETQFEKGEGLPGRVWATEKPTWVSDIAEEHNFPRLNAAIDEGMRAALAFPVRHGGRVLGVIEFLGPERLDPDQSLLAMMDTVGANVGQFLENQRTLEELHKSNRVKTEFLATMSHELRTPLNAMIGYSQLLLEGIPAPIPALAMEKVERISLSAKHLLGLIEEILSFSRIEAGQESFRIDEVDPCVIAEEVSHLVEPLAHEKGIAFESKHPAECGTVRTDPTKLRQILVNLLGNAIKFTEKGQVVLALREENDCVAFDVCDTGPGISPEHQSRIFEAFWQIDSGRTRQAGGTGLGLSVSRRLTRMLGGDVSVASELGSGSTFTVRLPKAGPAGAADGGPDRARLS